MNLRKFLPITLLLATLVSCTKEGFETIMPTESVDQAMNASETRAYVDSWSYSLELSNEDTVGVYQTGNGKAAMIEGEDFDDYGSSFVSIPRAVLSSEGITPDAENILYYPYTNRIYSQNGKKYIKMDFYNVKQNVCVLEKTNAKYLYFVGKKSAFSSDKIVNGYNFWPINKTLNIEISNVPAYKFKSLTVSSISKKKIFAKNGKLWLNTSLSYEVGETTDSYTLEFKDYDPSCTTMYCVIPTLAISNVPTSDVRYELLTEDGISYVIDKTLSGINTTYNQKIFLNCNDFKEYVDLGLPSKTLWAAKNVGASKVTDTGDFFAWGETTPQFGGTYSFGTYDLSIGGLSVTVPKLVKYVTQAKYSHNGSFTDNLTQLELFDDAAINNCSDNYWVMPTHADQQELYKYTKSVWTKSYNGTGVAGVVYTSTVNGRSLFLPAAGYWYTSKHVNKGVCGYYWSSTLDTSKNGAAYSIFFKSDFSYNTANITSYRACGLPVRGVHK